MQVGLWDYRGVARPADIAVTENAFPLGRYREPRRWSAKNAVGLSQDIANEHTIVIGPTRTGKTTSVIAPWIYEALRLGYSVVAVDVKGRGDLVSAVKKYGAGRGALGVRVVSWDYTNPADSASWDWIAGLRTESEINAAVEAICGQPNANDPNKFFHQSAIKYLRGLLQLASSASGRVSLEDVIGILNDQAQLESLVRGRGGDPGSTRLAELVGLSTGDFMKYTAELKTHLEVLDTSGFHSVTKPGALTLDILDAPDPVFVVVTAPVADGALADAACSLFLGQFMQRVLSGFGSAGRPILLALDEAARIQNRVDLGATLSLVAGAGVSVLLAVQDIGQFDDERRDEILANCGTMICLPRVSRATTDFMAGRLGDMYFASVSDSRSTDHRNGPSRSWTQVGERSAVLGHREIATPHPLLGEWPAVAHAPALSSRPILLDLTRPDLLH